jgi:hypothetical protein
VARGFRTIPNESDDVLAKDNAPDSRPIEPPERGPIIPIPEVGGLHHRYIRHAA